MRARLVDGTIITLEKDCDCLTHDGPHWLHMDRLYKAMNQKHIAGDRITDDMCWLAFATTERERLREKAYEMESRHIVEILNDMPPSEQVESHLQFRQ